MEQEPKDKRQKMAEEFSVDEHPHKRFNILTSGWVLVSPHRAKRPWLGQTSDKQSGRGSNAPLGVNGVPLTVDPKCYLCPNGTRAGTTQVTNPDYQGVFVFDNDFQAVLTKQPDYKPSDLFALVDRGSDTDGSTNLVTDLFSIAPVRGKCRVICYSPNHYETFADLEHSKVKAVIYNWMKIYYDFSMPIPVNPVAAGSDTNDRIVNYVQIFENKGAEMGCSNPHPHGQVWALEKVSENVSNEITNMKAYSQKHCTSANSDMCCMLCDYVKVEIKTARNQNSSLSSNRIVFENDSFVAVVPFWATWPFETMVLPKLHITNICQLLNPNQNSSFSDYIKPTTWSQSDAGSIELSADEIGDMLSIFSDINSGDSLDIPDESQLNTKLVNDFATILGNLTKTYDNLFDASFPYSMGIHQDPVLGHQDAGFCHLHLHFYPPLLRNAKIKKFFVGYEMLGEPQRDLSPEMAAQRLRDAIPKNLL